MSRRGGPSTKPLSPTCARKRTARTSASPQENGSQRGRTRRKNPKLDDNLNGSDADKLWQKAIEHAFWRKGKDVDTRELRSIMRKYGNSRRTFVDAVTYFQILINRKAFDDRGVGVQSKATGQSNGHGPSNGYGPVQVRARSKATALSNGQGPSNGAGPVQVRAQSKATAQINGQGPDTSRRTSEDNGQAGADALAERNGRARSTSSTEAYLNSWTRPDQVSSSMKPAVDGVEDMIKTIKNSPQNKGMRRSQGSSNGTGPVRVGAQSKGTVRSNGAALIQVRAQPKPTTSSNRFRGSMHLLSEENWQEVYDAGDSDDDIQIVDTAVDSRRVICLDSDPEDDVQIMYSSVDAEGAPNGVIHLDSDSKDGRQRLSSSLDARGNPYRKIYLDSDSEDDDQIEDSNGRKGPGLEEDQGEVGEEEEQMEVDQEVPSSSKAPENEEEELDAQENRGGSEDEYEEVNDVEQMIETVQDAQKHEEFEQLAQNGHDAPEAKEQEPTQTPTIPPPLKSAFQTRSTANLRARFCEEAIEEDERKNAVKEKEAKEAYEDREIKEEPNSGSDSDDPYDRLWAISEPFKREQKRMEEEDEVVEPEFEEEEEEEDEERPRVQWAKSEFRFLDDEDSVPSDDPDEEVHPELTPMPNDNNPEEVLPHEEHQPVPDGVPIEDVPAQPKGRSSQPAAAPTERADPFVNSAPGYVNPKFPERPQMRRRSTRSRPARK
ncbi:unnamed protein product [Caenorhabditis sp. 36 PRJEB53466]|nr:unnamed protein product [Caenorhabditis sp. 36 PRJEB53466]